VPSLRALWPVRRDTTAAASGALLFSFVLGLTSVAVPILALRSGYSVIGIGILTAVSALSQFGIRIFMSRLLRSVPDWQMIGASGLFLAGSCGVLAASSEVVPFAVSQALLGVARAFFWTASQTHAVRGPGTAVGALATVNLIAAVGTLAGPAFAGMLMAGSAQSALWMGAVVALVGTVPSLFLDRLPPFAPVIDRPPGRIWRRPGVIAGSWASVTAGAWRGLLSSYIPVVLDLARQPTSTIGILFSLANGASMAGTVIVGRLRKSWVPRSFVLGMLAVGLGTAFTGVAAHVTWQAAIALAVSGCGAGVLQVVGTAVASETVHPEERGEAISATGMFRAVALFVTPIAGAGLVALMPLAGVFAVLGVCLTLPAVYGPRLRGHLRRASGDADTGAWGDVQGHRRARPPRRARPRP
jgi:hypothetical protein